MLHCGSRQCGPQAEAADLQVPPRKAVVLMGKNTMMHKAIRGHLENNPALEKLLLHIQGNVGFVFTKKDLTRSGTCC